ncbi:MAG: threonylcarbamoyl-AMP synthase [Chloroflexi bacterium]|nr:threonylcarbamoyl-AMP synthase [Chloroflexota bacterium]
MRVLRAGGIVAFPTDTVYGLGCNAFNTQALVRIFEVKRRPRHLALPLLVSDMPQLREVAVEMSQAARLLAERFWPGALSLLLPRTNKVPDIVTARGNKVAVRLPAHPVPVFLARAVGAPLVGTSANLHGQPSCRTAEEVRRQLDGEVDMIVDGGETPGGIESTIVDVQDSRPVIIREGAISSGAIMQALREEGLCG